MTGLIFPETQRVSQIREMARVFEICSKAEFGIFFLFSHADFYRCKLQNDKQHMASKDHRLSHPSPTESYLNLRRLHFYFYQAVSVNFWETIC